MTVSSAVEAKLRGRPASSAPARAAGKVLGVEPAGEEETRRFSAFVHWGYGAAWGALRGVLGTLGLPGPAASAAHRAAVWGAEQVALPALDVSPPITQWPAKEIAIDAWHHLVYAAVTGTACDLLTR
jgi:hypothetical protein